MFTTVKYVILTAIRDWLFVGIIAALIGAVFLSYFLGNTVMVEKDIMIIEFSSASARLVSIVGMIVFVCFHVRRAFENKEIDLMLSRPISRSQFIFSYWLGFAIVSILILSIFSLYMLFTMQFDPNGFSAWFLTVILEILIVTAFALFASVILKSSVSSVLLSFAFYLVSRLMGFFSYVLDKNLSYDVWSFEYFSQKVIWFTSLVLPRLDLFSQSKWLAYGVSLESSDWILPIVQAAIFIPILLLFAALDFNKKQF